MSKHSGSSESKTEIPRVDISDLCVLYGEAINIPHARLGKQGVISLLVQWLESEEHPGYGQSM
jgi:hypothetical protein